MFDRFSNHATPSATPPASQRSYSPAPRRPSHLAPPSRPGAGLRSTSLSQISRANSSTDSLARGTRVPNGSALRQGITPPVRVDDPLDVLQNIIGGPVSRADNAAENTPTERPQSLSENIDFQGLSLEGFAAEVSKSIHILESEQSSARSAEEFEKERDEFEDLHRSILACDNVLKSVEISLAGFQKDLGVVSTEIETLQSRSTALNTKLENRKVVEKLLGPAVEEISISPIVVKTISEGQINDNWVKALVELQKRVKAVEGRMKASDESSNAKAVSDIKPLLDNLVGKATERIRDYLVSQIKALRSPNINAQIIQQRNLVKYKDLYAFLATSHPDLAEAVGQAYVNTIRWYYLNHFTRYRQALDKLNLVNVDKSDVLGSDPSQPRSKAPGAPSTHDAHNIGRRADILKSINSPVLSAYLASEDTSPHYIETPFRSFNLALIDNVSSEYTFLSTFFSPLSFQQISRRCSTIFAPTFKLGASLTTDLISPSTDCLGILLCVRLTQSLSFALQRRKVPVAEGYVNGLNMLLWPRFQVAMDMHCDSIKLLASTVSSRSAASKLSFTSTASTSSDLSTAPHFLTQRVAQFLYGILAISQDAGDDEPVAISLARLRAEYEAFLAKASKSVGADGKKRERFLGNNLALVRAIIADSEGRLAGEMKKHFEEAGEGTRGR